MHESLHLVALDNRFDQDYPLLIVWLFILNPLTPTRCLEWQIKNLFIPLPWSPSIYTTAITTIIVIFIISSTTWNVLPYLMIS